MPYCTSCGAEVGQNHGFCRRCGASQRATAPSSAASGGGGLGPQGASILCYVPWFGWIAAVYVLVAERFRGERTARFHAYQGLYLFVAWMLVHWAFGLWVKLLFDNRFPLDGILQLAMLALWIYMLVVTSKGDRVSLPVVGELAERSL